MHIGFFLLRQPGNVLRVVSSYTYLGLESYKVRSLVTTGEVTQESSGLVIVSTGKARVVRDRVDERGCYTQ